MRSELNLDNRLLCILYQMFFVVFSGYYPKDVEIVLFDFFAMYSWLVESSFAHAFVSILGTIFF